jgi:O-antigen/teichoic acid export membrane protein
MLSGVVMAPVVWITNSMLANQPDGYGELGLFNAANQWRIFIVLLPGLLMTAMLPILADRHGRGDKDGFDKALTFNFRITWIIALPLTVTTIVLGEQLAALFGSQFSGAESMISLLMIATFLNLLATPVGTALAGAGKMWTGVLMNCGWGLVLIVVGAYLVPRNGGAGLAAAYVVAYLMHVVWVMAYVEAKLVRGVVSKVWRLGLFTIFLIAATFAVLTITNHPRLIGLLSTLLVAISFWPLFAAMRLTIVPRQEAAK